MDYAPIALFVYNRPWHTALVIDALQDNDFAAQSNLYIFSDGPKSDKDIKQVAEVRKLINSVKGFASVNVVARDYNLGLANSVISGVTEVIERHGKIIVLEDDLVTSPYFLSFMNNALKFYNDEEKVVSIHGYFYPVSGELPETFFLKDTGSWGWATWKRGWELFEPNGTILLQQLECKKLLREFDMDGAYPFSKILKDQIAGRVDSWAIRWQASAFLHDCLTLFPGRSMVNNIGNDGSGVNCGLTNLFDSTLADRPIKVCTVPVEENRAVLELLKSFFRTSGSNIFVRYCMTLRRCLSAIRRILL